MPVEFKSRVADLKNATKQVLVNRGKFKNTDVADLMVSECVATFRAVGTSTEIPVNGISPGTARIPLSALDAIARTAGMFKRKEVTVLIEDGGIKVDTFRHSHPHIKLGILPDQSIDLPIDASLLDTLGVGAVLTESAIERQGLTNRILDAWERANRSITSAAGSLAALGVTEEQIRQLVEKQVTAAGQRLIQAFSSRR
jgi:hypothetical protein